MYKLLALDMDGTTLNSQKKITPKTVDAINKLLKSGVEVVVASGRCLAELSDYRNEFRNMHYVILTSGGLIYNLAADKPISIYPVSFEDCIKLIEIGEEENAMVHLLTIKNSVAKPQDIENISDFTCATGRSIPARFILTDVWFKTLASIFTVPITDN